MSSRVHTAGERILGFECDTAGELAELLKGFTGVGMGGNGSLGYFNAKADWNIDVKSSAHTPPSMKKGKMVSACQDKAHIYLGVSDTHQSEISSTKNHPPPHSHCYRSPHAILRVWVRE